MRRRNLLPLLAASILFVWTVSAATAVPPTPTNQSDETPEATMEGALSPEPLETMPGQSAAVRLHDLVGLAVKNGEDVSLGKIDDLVIDRSTGKVTHVALGSGGVMGFGEKLYVVPWSAISLKHDANHRIDFVFLDISKDRLKDAPAFDWSKLNQLSDPQFANSIETFYSKAPTAGRTPTERR